MANAKKAATKAPRKAAKKQPDVFSDAEKEAMREARKERRKGAAADGEADLLAKIGELSGLDRELAEQLHEIVTTTAPELKPRTWYGMPAYAGDDGKAILYFSPAAKFKERYASLGFNTGARLDDGNMWPTSFALTRMTAVEKKRIAELVKKAVG